MAKYGSKSWANFEAGRVKIILGLFDSPSREMHELVKKNLEVLIKELEEVKDNA